MNYKKPMLVLIALSGLMLLSYITSYKAASWKAWQPLELATIVPPNENSRWLLYIHRSNEKNFEEDTEHPFRNSPMALYKRIENNNWVKASNDIMTRSTSTSFHAPTKEYQDFLYKQFVNNNIKTFKFGYRSVPIGFYSLTSDTKDDIRRLLISEWGFSDGRVILPVPQEIYTLSLDNTETTSTPQLYNHGVTARSSVKNKCLIHPTITQSWSYRDTDGCITISHPQNGYSEASDWDYLTEILQKHHLFDENDGFGLLLEDCNCDEAEITTCSLPEKISIDFVRKAGKFYAVTERH